jgi:hypothetical protein
LPPNGSGWDLEELELNPASSAVKIPSLRLSEKTFLWKPNKHELANLKF